MRIPPEDYDKELEAGKTARLEYFRCQRCRQVVEIPHVHSRYKDLGFEVETIMRLQWAIVILLVIVAIIGMVTCTHAGNVADAVG